jgi:hypothetical protein
MVNAKFLNENNMQFWIKADYMNTKISPLLLQQKRNHYPKNGR